MLEAKTGSIQVWKKDSFQLKNGTKKERNKEKEIKAKIILQEM